MSMAKQAPDSDSHPGRIWWLAFILRAARNRENLSASSEGNAIISHPTRSDYGTIQIQYACFGRTDVH